MKKLSSPSIIRITLLVSLGLHGLLLMLPTPSSEPPITSKPVKVVKLPKPTPRLIAQRNVPLPKLKAVQTTVARSPLQPQPAPSTPPIKSPPTRSSSPPTPKPSPTNQPARSTQPDVDKVIADFSQIAGAEQGCKASEECWQVNDTQWRSVAGNLAQKLESQGYSVNKLEELDDDTGMGIYRVVSKNGEKKYYLHLLSTTQRTVYLLDSEQLTRQELELKVAG